MLLPKLKLSLQHENKCEENSSLSIKKACKVTIIHNVSKGYVIK